MTTQPNTDALREAIHSCIAAANRHFDATGRYDAKPMLDGIMQLIAQYDQARLTAILAQLPEKEARPESGPKRNGTAQAVRKAHNQAIDQCTVAITAAFEAVV